MNSMDVLRDIANIEDNISAPVRQREVGSQSNPVYEQPVSESAQVFKKPTTPGYCRRCNSHPISNIRSSELCGICVDKLQKIRKAEQAWNSFEKQRELNLDKLVRIWHLKTGAGRYPGTYAVQDLSTCFLCAFAGAPVRSEYLVAIAAVGWDRPVEGSYGVREQLVGLCSSCRGKELHVVEWLAEGGSFKPQQQGKSKKSFLSVELPLLSFR